MSHLTLLSVPGSIITDEGLQGITCMKNFIIYYYRKMSHLTLLSVPGSIITDEGLQGITCMKNLESLDISHCSRIGSPSLDHIGQLTSLKHLNISDCLFNTVTQNRVYDYVNAPKPELNDLSSLKTLDLVTLNASNCNVGDASLVVLGGMVSLEVLNLSLCVGVTDVGVKDLVDRAVKLRSIDLSQCCNITEGGLLQLRRRCTVKC